MKNGYTGGLLEADTFPAVLPGAKSQYVTWAEAMKAWNLVKENQPWDPTEPEGWAGDLHSEVAIALGLEDWSHLCLFSATGSALDWHGTDAWFEIAGVHLTLDVTANPAKFDGYKADIIVPPEAVEDPVERGELAATIAAELLARRKEAEATQRAPRRMVRRQRIGA
ncbi:MAG TPA: hypothetical protein VI937_02085 [Negativicutes bacterium]|nr:hypothetical protein [Negativicutes bacterium]